VGNSSAKVHQEEPSKKKNIAIAIILILFAIKGAVLIFIIPFWHLSNESSCVSYIEVLANKHEVLVYSDGYPDDVKKSVKKYLQSELEAVKKTVPKSQAERQQKMIFERDLQQRIVNLDNESPIQAGFSPLYYSFGAAFFLAGRSFGIPIQIIILRFLSLIFGLGAVYLAYLIAQRIFPEDAFLQLFIPILFMLNPVFSVYSSSAVIDSLLILIFSAVLYQMIVVIKTSLTPKAGIFLLLAIAAGLATKPKFLLVLPLLLLVLLFDFCRRINISPLKSGGSIQPGRLFFVGLLFIVFLITWPVLNTLFLRELSPIFTGVSPSFVKFMLSPGFLERVSQQCWGYMGYLSPWDFEINIVLKIFTLIGLFGVIIMVVKAIIDIGKATLRHDKIVTLSGTETKEESATEQKDTDVAKVDYHALGEHFGEIIGGRWPIWTLLLLAIGSAYYMTTAQEFIASLGVAKQVKQANQARYLFLSVIPCVVFLAAGIRALLPVRKQIP